MTKTMTNTKPNNISSSLSSWDNRTRFVIAGLVFLFLVSWTMALGRLIGDKFWNPSKNVKEIETILLSVSTMNVTEETTTISEELVPDLPWFIPIFLKDIGLSYYTTRYMVFFPHVIGSIIWWNLYYIQLIPSIRRKYKKFHRVLGRLLLLCSIAQTTSGIGLAYMGNSSTIKIVSTFFGIAVMYCTYYSWYYAANTIHKDISKHKYWATRLVGYMQGIALQRVFMVLLILSHELGWNGLYPPFLVDDNTIEDNNNGSEIVKQIFDDSFICSILAAIYFTEWYLAGVYGWTTTVSASTSTAVSTSTSTTVSSSSSTASAAVTVPAERPMNGIKLHLHQE